MNGLILDSDTLRGTYLYVITPLHIMLIISVSTENEEMVDCVHVIFKSLAVNLYRKIYTSYLVSRS